MLYSIDGKHCKYSMTRKPCLSNLTVAIQNPDVSYYENTADPDQMASTKPADQDTHGCSLNLNIRANNMEDASK